MPHRFSTRTRLPGLAWLCLASVPVVGQDQPPLDWVPRADLPPAMAERLGSACSGAYLDPLADAEAADPATAPIVIDANRATRDGPQIELQGDIEIQQGERRITATAMRYDQTAERASLDGPVTIRQPGMLVTGSGAEMNMAGREAEFNDGRFVMHENHLRGSAGRIEQRGDGIVVLEDGLITSCEPGAEAWRVRGESLRINTRSRRGYGRNVWLDIQGVPVFYLPYFTFPVGSDRQSGVLAPSISRTNGGLDLAVPFYWNLAPNYDLTITPRYAGGHGAMVEAEARYLSRYSYNSLAMAYLPDDKGGGDLDVDELVEQGADENLLRPYVGDSRWLVNLEHNGLGRSGLFSEIAYARASDIDYLRELSVASFGISSETFLTQRATVGYRLPNWTFALSGRAYQNLLADLAPNYRQVPSLAAQGDYQFGRWGLELNQVVTRFEHPDPDYLTGTRLNLDYALSYRMEPGWGFVRPEGGVQGLAYWLDDTNLQPDADTSPALGTYWASLDTGLVFERDNGRQTLTPRLYYLYRHYRDHQDLYDVSLDGGDVNFDTTPLTFNYNQLFRDRRFIGGDRLDDANQLSVGLTFQWFDEDRLNPAAGFSVGQVIYLEDRRVLLAGGAEAQTGQESDWAGQFFARLGPYLDLSGDAVVSPESGRISRASLGVGFGRDYTRYINVEYRFLREDELAALSLPVDQLDTVFTFPFREQWQVVGRLFWDIEQSRELDAFVGFQYDDCCYRLRVLARRWLDSRLAALVTDPERGYDQGIFFEADFKGLASSGERIRSLLAEHLPLFRDDHF